MISKIEVAPGVCALAGRHPAGTDVTSTIVSSGTSAVVFDSLCFPDDTRELLQEIKNQHVDLVAFVNTHWHADHTAGNRLFNAHKISHISFLELMRTELPKQLASARQMIGEEVRVDPPDETFDKKLQLPFGEKQLTLLHLPGHTPDSIAGYVEVERILVAGDTVMELPYLSYGNSADLIESLRGIEKMSLDTIIQGHGRPCNKAKVAEDREYLEGLRRLVGEGVQSGESLEKLEKIPLDTFLALERSKQLPPLFKDHIHRENLAKVYAELTSSSKSEETRVPS